MNSTSGGDGAGWHTGSLNPGTGGVRDSYHPSTGSAWQQAEYAKEAEREVREGKKPILTHVWIAIRRSIWGE